MPLVRMTASVACDDLPDTVGGEVQLSPERAQQVIGAGWAELVRGGVPETPESRVDAVEHAVDSVERELTARRRRARRGGDTSDDSPGGHQG